jgi:hypothetical protein
MSSVSFMRDINCVGAKMLVTQTKYAEEDGKLVHFGDILPMQCAPYQNCLTGLVNILLSSKWGRYRQKCPKYLIIPSVAAELE